MSISENLKRLRTESNLTQDDIAKCLGRDRSAYAFWETGKTSPSPKQLVTLSKIFNVSIDEIVLDRVDRHYMEFPTMLSEPENNILYYLLRDEQIMLVTFRLLSDNGKQQILDHLRDIAEEESGEEQG